MSHFDFRNLAYLEAAVTAGSVRGGAEVLNTSPSALSRQIAKMETELNVPLLERHGRGVRPTEAGTLFLSYFQDQRRQIETVVEGVWQILGLQRGAIAIALGRGFGEAAMAVMKQFSKTHPSVQLNLSFGSTDEIVQKIVEGDAHIGLAYNPPKDPKLHCNAAKLHPMCAITKPSHPLTTLSRRVRISDLVNYDLGLLPGKFGIRQTLLHAEDDEHVMLAPKLIANSDFALERFALEWDGVTVSPAFGFAAKIANGDLVATEFEEPYLRAAEAQLLTRRGRKLSPAASALLQAFKASLNVIRP
ncbi:LysR family transcriptional regulator [Rhizobium sp. R693]|uniref:LysR family transcriptional regulator n=1 Tax=Rhizobium sp. R693 TaxID=1764276 RepID=UPI000B52ABE4|nr:LysR family transcriptional regulator [Rhizobium sp. R693]OWV93622.1 hypothetical protein ATY79_27190 [Rhizobium sp. R693]